MENTKDSIHWNYDLLVIERASKEGIFIFKYNKNPGTYG